MNQIYNALTKPLTKVAVAKVADHVKSEAVDKITTTAKGFVWRYVIIGNIVTASMGFAIGFGVAYLIFG